MPTNLKFKISRRQGLKLMGCAGLSSGTSYCILGLTPVLGVGFHKSALALDPVTVTAGIGVAQAALGFLARRKQGPDMSQVMAQASVDYLRILSTQVGSLQDGVAYIILSLEKIRDHINKQFELASLRTLHEALGKVQYRYRLLMDSASDSASFQEWRKTKNFESDWRELETQVDNALDLAANSQRSDALTTLLLASVLHVAIGAYLAMDRTTHEMKVRVQAVLDIFEKAANPAVPLSAAQALAQGTAELLDVRGRLANEGVQLPLNGGSARVELASISVQHLSASTSQEVSKCKREPKKGGGGKGSSEGGSADSEFCWTEIVTIPGVLGEASSFQFRADIAQLPILESDGGNGKAYAVLAYKFQGDTAVAATAVTSGTIRAEAKNEAARRTVAQSHQSGGGAALSKRVRIDGLLEEHNLRAAIVALNGIALSELSNTRHNLFKFFGVPL